MQEQTDVFGIAETAKQEDLDAPHIRIYADRSALYGKDRQRVQIFMEGTPSLEAKQRASRIREKLEAGFLGSVVERCRKGTVDFDALTEDHRGLLQRLDQAITSQVGRAAIGLLVLQMTVKAIQPSQSVRLHKAGRGDFSWADGIPMRIIDQAFVTPVLRNEGLLRVNKYGVMMTRSLAENYPYTKFYKAALRGAKREWLEIVDLLEAGEIAAQAALEYTISLLIKRSDQFKSLADEVVGLAKATADALETPDNVLRLLSRHMTYPGVTAARLLEVSMHSLVQALDEMGALEGLELRPLSQMRQANKKAGNIGDIELLSSGTIVEAWDAKFGKPYLYDELLELSDKVSQQCWPALQVAGFVTDRPPDLRDDVQSQKAEIEDRFALDVQILSFDDWVSRQAAAVPAERKQELARRWFIAYAEALALHRPKKAPIDEPTESWLTSLRQLLTEG